jgi:hypothetical protein
LHHLWKEYSKTSIPLSFLVRLSKRGKTKLTPSGFSLVPLPERWCPSRFFLRNAGAPLTFPLLRLPLFPRRSAQVRLYSVVILPYNTNKLQLELETKILLGLSLTRSERSSEQPTRTAAHLKVNYRPFGSLEPNSLFIWIGFA